MTVAGRFTLCPGVLSLRNWLRLAVAIMLSASALPGQKKIVIKKSDHTTGSLGSVGLVPPNSSLLNYHNDAQRTGWNQAEFILAPASVTTASFGLLKTINLDDKIDTQPLVVADQEIEGSDVHTVVYVATEGNTVYAIDSVSGQILKSRKLGVSVPNPLDCTNNGSSVGINGTPAIDLQTRTIYVVTYTMQNSHPSYQLHALSLSNLQDRPGSPVSFQRFT